MYVIYDLVKAIINIELILLLNRYVVDVLWGQPIKLAQVASTSELCENQRNNLFFFEIVPCHFCRASEVQT